MNYYLLFRGCGGGGIKNLEVRIKKKAEDTAFDEEKSWAEARREEEEDLTSARGSYNPQYAEKLQSKKTQVRKS